MVDPPCELCVRPGLWWIICPSGKWAVTPFAGLIFILVIKDRFCCSRENVCACIELSFCSLKPDLAVLISILVLSSEGGSGAPFLSLYGFCVIFDILCDLTELSWTESSACSLPLTKFEIGLDTPTDPI